MPSGQSSWPVIAAIAAAAVLAVAKFVVADLSGSAAMLAEGIYSAVDMLNGGLLFLGQRRSGRPPDELHPFGHGMELYFWTLLVALIIFVVGGGVSIAEGVVRTLAAEDLSGFGWTYAVLGITLVANGTSWYVALRDFRARQGRRSFREELRKSKDPTVLTVLFEDSASLVGVVIAFAGVLLSQLWQTSIPDGIASILIGLVMGTVAVGLVMQCRTLIIGETATDELQTAVRAAVEGDGAVERVTELKTLQLGPDRILVALRVRFRDGLASGSVGDAVARLERAIHEQRPECRSVFITPAAMPRPGPET